MEDTNPFPIDHGIDQDFGPNSVLLDFTSGPENAHIPYLGAALRDEGGLSSAIRSIAEVPPRSVLSRLTDHYLEIIANRAPVGFEAEYVSHRNVTTMYRGILMPFSSGGDEIDFIYGVINWKDVVEIEADVRSALESALTESPPPTPAPAVWGDTQLPYACEEQAQFSAPSLEPMVLEVEGALGMGAALYERLAIARETADTLNFSEQRTRSALYAALGQAFDFALAARDDPETYADILEDAGLKAQERAPMTPLVKLIFGATYDKTRLAEYAAVLCHALRIGLSAGSLPSWLEAQTGGLKGVVQAERAFRRPATRPDREAAARAKLSAAPVLAAVPIANVDCEYVSLIGRRETDGSVSIVSIAAADPAQLLRAAKHLQQ